jgi:hypothetical protein
MYQDPIAPVYRTGGAVQPAVMPDSYNPYNTGLKIDSMNSGGFGVNQLPPQQERIGANTKSPYGAVDYNEVAAAPSETPIDYSPAKGAVGAPIPEDEELRRKNNRENAEGRPNASMIY